MNEIMKFEVENSMCFDDGIGSGYDSVVGYGSGNVRGNDSGYGFGSGNVDGFGFANN